MNLVLGLVAVLAAFGAVVTMEPLCFLVAVGAYAWLTVRNFR